MFQNQKHASKKWLIDKRTLTKLIFKTDIKQQEYVFI